MEQLTERNTGREYLVPASQTGGAEFDYSADDLGSFAVLNAYWNVLRKQQAVILAILLIVPSLVAIASFRMTPIYRATARVQVDMDLPTIEGSSQRLTELPTDEDFLGTQLEILKTDHLAWRTIEQLQLSKSRSFLGPLADRAQADTTKDKNKMIKRFAGMLSVQLVRGTRVVEIGFESEDPKLAADVVNALVNNYIENNFREKYNSTRLASENLEQQMQEMKAKVEESQRALVNYEGANAIANVGDRQNVVEQRMSELTHELTVAQTDRFQKEALYKLVVSNPEKIGMMAQDQLIQQLEGKRADLNSELVSANTQYGPSFPKVIRLKEELQALDQNLSQQRSLATDRIRRDYQAAANREGLLLNAVARQKDELSKFNKLLVQENILKGEFQTNQQLYQRLLQHLKDASVEAGLRSTNIHVIDPAYVPDVPVRPRRILNTALGALAALVLGIVVAFIRESMDTSIKAPEEVEVMMRTPLLATIPRFESQWRVLPGQKRTSLLAGDHLGTEAFRSLRTSVLLSKPLSPPKVLLVTSANPSEGKSSVSANVASVFAQRSSRVILVDCDLRKPTVAKNFGVPNLHGTTDVLTGAVSLESAVVKVALDNGLEIMPSGSIPPNPAELLSSEEFKRLLSRLRERYDHIVIDSPPLLSVTDATILSTYVDGVLLVAEPGSTPRKALARAVRMLRGAGAPLLGVVMNKFDARRFGYEYGYGYNYGSYGNGYGQTAKTEKKSLGSELNLD